MARWPMVQNGFITCYCYPVACVIKLVTALICDDGATVPGCKLELAPREFNFMAAFAGQTNL